ncbi:MFS transporter [Actinopolymorpha cephalotaxi]|uniref:SET family sugar efflux transporter-like MFS transporter n=1 Tax=Actinopolymorpha cephalotaxi TaxID=504797 RepID=A0ABX2S3E1_9ACTN|nr:MFS transporter [Actinopolymorpha cephalotaxi]NYH84114.1 SET family sugar efflux transporter-like MFS transporter [Actinopolymorpha cephalotaxi]
MPSSALLWGLQIAFLSPALALILVTLYGATTAEVGWVLAIYNAGGFIASLLLPAYADRKHDYLGPMLACGVLTVLLAAVLATVTSLQLATIALIVIGGPAGVGSSMLYAHLRHSGARPADVVNTRAIVSVAWIAGPPLATFIIGWFGNRAVLLAIAAVAVLNIVTTLIMISQGRVAQTSGAHPAAAPPARDEPPVGRAGVVLITAAFVLLQATNATGMTILTVYVTETMRLDGMWAGIALGVAAALEVPALIGIGRLTERFSSLGLIATSCLAGIAYYLGLAFAAGPVALIALQPLNAWSFAGIGGVGLTLFQRMIPRPGLSTGLYMNTRRIGSIVSGPIIAFGSITALGQRGIFVASAALTLAGLLIISLGGRITTKKGTADPAVLPVPTG